MVCCTFTAVLPTPCCFCADRFFSCLLAVVCYFLVFLSPRRLVSAAAAATAAAAWSSLTWSRLPLPPRVTQLFFTILVYLYLRAWRAAEVTLYLV